MRNMTYIKNRSYVVSACLLSPDTITAIAPSLFSLAAKARVSTLLSPASTIYSDTLSTIIRNMI